MESLLIEIDKDVFGASSNILIGVVYRMPDSSVDVLSDRMNDVLNIIKMNANFVIFLAIWTFSEVWWTQADISGCTVYV